MAEFLDNVLSEEPASSPPEPVAEVQPEAPITEPVAQPETPQAPPEAKPEPGFVPISALMDERDRRKQAEAQRDQFQARQQPASIPDPLDDPTGYNAYLESRLEDRMVQERLTMSDLMARQVHGADTVESSVNWANEKAQTDPAFLTSWQHAIRSEAHPIDWIVRQHQRDAMVSGLGNAASLDTWFEQEAAKRGYAPPSASVAAAPVAAVPPVARPAAPPVSIASEAPASAPAHNDVSADFLGNILRK